MKKCAGIFGAYGCRWVHLTGYGAIMVAILFGLLDATPDLAQSQEHGSIAGYEFEVASVTPSNPDAIGGFMTLPGKGVVSDHFIERNIALMKIIRAAYGIPFEAADARILGAPGWLNSEKYDINAKIDGSAVEELKKLSQDQRTLAQEQMLQALLTDRFRLIVHRETKELPIYTLALTKGGAKLQAARPDEAGAISYGPGLITGEAKSTGNLAQLLSVFVARPVVDKTGLAGNYDFKLKWAPGDGQAVSAGASPQDSEPFSVFTAIQEQLGLKLVSAKGPVQVIVIDHVERPSAN
jgi:uncharacterized protein (TIGR03435 family)